MYREGRFALQNFHHRFITARNETRSLQKLSLILIHTHITLMPLFGMAREPKNKNKDAEAAPSTEEEKARPGTSGTELLLTSNRREASKQFQKAQRAEQTYKAKKRASAARRDLQSARHHFKESASHLKAGTTMLITSIKAVPYMFSEKMDERRKARNAATKKRLEERLARESADGAPADKAPADDKTA